jgi:hypothetical protein
LPQPHNVTVLSRRWPELLLVAPYFAGGRAWVA